jgi:hypothetical protein
MRVSFGRFLVRQDGLGPYDSVDEMVNESAAVLMGERADDGEEGRPWVLPSEIAYHTGLDESVVMEAMLRLDERPAGNGDTTPDE